MSEQTKVSEGLAINIEKLLDNAGISLQEVDNFGVVLGPGSFTGVRVGLATIKGFCLALNKSCYAKNSFEVFDKKITNGFLVLKCTNTTCYYAQYVENKVIDFGVLNNTEVEDFVKDKTIYSIEGFADFSTVNIYNEYLDLLNDCFKETIEKDEQVEADTLQPFYVQLSQAELQQKKEK